MASLEDWDSQYCGITVLRLLLRLEKEKLREEKKKEREDADVNNGMSLISTLMDHNLERQAEHPGIWQYETEFMVDFIYNKLQLQERFQEEQVHRAAGIIMTNATTLSLPPSFGRATAIYPVYSLMNNSCFPSSKTMQNPLDQSQEMVAVQAMVAGQEVTNQYVSSLLPTVRRRPLLRSKWHFDCLCQRCKDPTELGSHLGSLLCQRRRCGGEVLQRCSYVLPPGTQDARMWWECIQCQTSLSSSEVSAILDDAETLIAERLPGETGVERCERLLHSFSTVLHPNNWLLVGVKQELALLYPSPGSKAWQGLARPGKERKVQVCQEVLEVLSKVEVVASGCQTRILGELTTCRVMVAREDFLQGRIDRRGLQGVIVRAKVAMLIAAQRADTIIGAGRGGIKGLVKQNKPL